MTDTYANETALEMQRAFDESFARPVSYEREVVEDLLSIRAGDRALVVRAREVSRVLECPRITPVPSRPVALCGLAGIRGTLVAVYSIAALIGEEMSEPNQGWLVVSRADRSAAFLFDQLLGYRRVPAREIRRLESPDLGGERVTELARIDNDNRPMISISRLLEDLRRSVPTGAGEE